MRTKSIFILQAIATRPVHGCASQYEAYAVVLHHTSQIELASTAVFEAHRLGSPAAAHQGLHARTHHRLFATCGVWRWPHSVLPESMLSWNLGLKSS